MSRTRSIGIRLLLIALVLAAAGGAYAFGGGVLGTTAATYNVGGINLKVNSAAFYNGSAYAPSTWSAKDLQPYVDKFFTFSDIKPGDYGRTVISLHVKKASAWVCLAFSNFKDLDNGVNEPEDPPDLNNEIRGELGNGMEFFAWRDDGDNVFEVGEVPLFGTTTQSAIQTLKDKTYALADYAHGPAWLANSVHYVGISWCAGNLTVNLTTAVIICDGTALGNEAQTDSLSLDVSLTAVPYTQSPKFLCTPQKDECEEDDDDDDDEEYEDDDSVHDDYDGKDRDGDGKDHDWGHDKDDYDGKDRDKDGKDHDGADDRDDHDGKDSDKDGKDHDGNDDDEDDCDDKDKEKEEICHFTSSKKNPTQILEVSHSAVDAHITNHGDYVIETDQDEQDCREGKRHDEEDDKEHEYSWYNWGYDSYGHGGSCNLGKRS